MSDDPTADGDGPATGSWASLGLRFVSFAAVWLVLVDGKAIDSWYIGLPTVVLATLATYRLVPTPGGRIRPWGLARFIPYFVGTSVVGAVDVGLRALRPSRPLAPELVRYELRVPADALAAVFFAEIISLLPGTLCTALEEEYVEVHVVDRQWPIDAQLAELEARVAGVFGEALDGPDSETRA